MSDPAAVPEHGRSPADLLATIDEMAAGDIDWRGGKAFSLVYNVDDAEHEELLGGVARRFLHDNALNPFKYPSLLQMELDLIAMACGLFGTEPTAGALTSGGTESIFLAVQVARDHARAVRGIAEPRLVTPATAHPAFAKAAMYLDIEHVRVPVAADGRADVAATAAARSARNWSAILAWYGESIRCRPPCWRSRFQPRASMTSPTPAMSTPSAAARISMIGRPSPLAAIPSIAAMPSRIRRVVSRSVVVRRR